MQYAKTLTLWGANLYNMENTDYNVGPMSEAPHTDEEKNKLIGNLIRSLRQAKYRMSDTLEIQTGNPKNTLKNSTMEDEFDIFTADNKVSEEKLHALFASGCTRKLEVIKCVKERTKCELVEAKRIVDKAAEGTQCDSTGKGGCLSAVAIVFMAATGAIISALFL